MFVGNQCFADQEAKAFIQSNGSVGLCDITGNNQKVIDIVELEDFFSELLQNFQPSKAGSPLIELLQKDWAVFTEKQYGVGIINYFLADTDNEFQNALSHVSYSEEILGAISYWDELKQSLKWESRYITNIIKLEELGWDGFFNTQFKLSRKRILYRARVHHESGENALLPGNLKSPPREKSRGGRANPSGIPYLYLCDNSKTVLYEVRASYLDELSIGKFKVIRPLRIVDFTERTSIFSRGSVSETIKAQLLRRKINVDLSKPMRRYDSELEYIPTQFICEYIRVITGADGIQFQSSLHPKGKNIVVFDDNLTECVDVMLVKVDKTMLGSIKME